MTVNRTLAMVKLWVCMDFATTDSIWQALKFILIFRLRGGKTAAASDAAGVRHSFP